MKWLLNENKEWKSCFHLFNTSLVIFDSLSAIPPILVGYMIDEGLQKGNQILIIQLGIFLICFAILRQLGSYFSAIALDKTCFHMASNIKQKCYKKLNELDGDFYSTKEQGELMTIGTSDIGEIRRHAAWTIKTVLHTLIRFIISFSFCFYLEPTFTLLLLLPTPFILIFSLLFKKKTNPLYQKRRKYLASLNNYIQDNIEGNKVVKAFACEENEIKEMNQKNKIYKDSNIEINDIRTFYFSFVNFFTNSMTFIFLLVGGYFLINEKISMGSFIIFQSSLSDIKNPFSRLGEIMDRIQNFHIAKERVTELLNTEPTVKTAGTIKLPSLMVPITFKDVSVTFDQNLVMEDLNLTIEPGKTIAFIGPTGSGKSSVTNLILQFIEPKKGEILIGNTNLREIDTKWLRSKIGYVIQQPFLFSDTILNNICYGNDQLTKEEIEKISKSAHLTYVDSLEAKYETIIGEKGVGLSGGEKQRLSLARALAVKPELLILDDITSALDIETEQTITKSIKKLNTHCTKIIIAQKIVSVKDADQIYVISDHKVLEHGTHKGLLKNKKYYYEIYKIQNNIKEGCEKYESKSL